MEQCCERDHNNDGNCDVHSEKWSLWKEKTKAAMSAMKPVPAIGSTVHVALGHCCGAGFTGQLLEIKGRSVVVQISSTRKIIGLLERTTEVQA